MCAGRRLPTGLAAAGAVLVLALLAGAPTSAVAWDALGLMLGAAATAGAAVGTRRALAADDPPRTADASTTTTPADGDRPTPAAPDVALVHRLQAAADLSPDVIRILDADGRVRWANRTACVRTSRRLDDLRGHEAFDPQLGYRVDPETRARLDEGLGAGQPFAESVDLASAAGRILRLNVRGQPITGPEGTPDGWVTVEQDVTELHDRTDLLDLVLDASRAGMWDWDVVTSVVRTTPNMHRMIAEPVPAGPVTLEWFTSRVHPEDAAMLDRQLQASLTSDEAPFEVTFRFGREDHWVWIRTTGRVVARDAGGRPLRMIGLHVDLDEVHRSMTAAREATQLLHAIIDLVPARICWKDGDGRHLGANRAYRVDHGDLPMVGHTDADLGLDPDEVVLRARREAEARRRAAHTPEQVERWTRPDGTAAWRQVTCRPLHDGEGTVIGTISSYQDVTDLQSAAEQLERARDHAEAASLAKSEFLANMSHEIRTPMTAILGFAELLDESGDEAEDRRRRDDAVETIRRNGDQLLAILNDILDLSKIEAGRLTVECIPVRPTTILADVQRLLANRAEGKGIALEVGWETPVPAMVGTDPVRLRQILTNVVGNAIKFTETGEVRILAGYEPPTGGDAEGAGGTGRLRVTVCDSGIGMEPEQVEHVFDAFSQADSSTTRRFGGTGLGLRISRSLAEALGGTLECESRPGVGSTFTLMVDAAVEPAAELISAADATAETMAHGRGVPAAGAARTAGSLPVAAPTATAASADGSATTFTPAGRPDAAIPTAERPLSGRRILLAEDGPDNQRLIGFHLRKAGADLVIAENGRVAVTAVEDAQASGRPFDLILMDVQMPEMDGYAATRAIRTAGHRLPILALTAHAMAADRRRSAEAGCNGHLTKPIDRHGLIAEILAWVGDGEGRSRAAA